MLIFRNKIILVFFLLLGTSSWLSAASNLTDTQLNVDDNSLFFQNTKLGILRNSPEAALDVNGSARFCTAGFQREIQNTPAGNTVTIDWNQGNKQRLKIGSLNLTVSFTNIITPAMATNLLLIIEHVGSGTITWAPSSALRWPGGQAPSLSTAYPDLINFYFSNGVYYGIPAYNFY